jgi:hypothetical protein
MRPKNIPTTSKIGNRPRHPQNTMYRARRQLQQVDRVFQHRLIARRESAGRIRFRLVEMRVASTCALSLYFARAYHARTDHITGFARRRIGSQFGRRQPRHFQMQVDAFEQGAGDLAAIAQNCVGMAATSSRRIARPPTRA